ETVAAELTPVVSDALANSDVVVLSDYAKGTLHRAGELIALCRTAGLPVLVDPKGDDFDRYRGATLLTPNENEFRAVAGAWSSEDQFLQKGDAVRAEFDLDALLVTRGERGMALFTRAEPPVLLEAEAREVFDVTGAGDTVIALMA